MVPFLGENCCTTTIVTILSGLGVLYLYFKYVFGHWERNNIPSISPEIPFGNIKQFLFLKKSMSLIINEVYTKFRDSGKLFAGIYVFWKPHIVLIDPDTIKLVLTKEFQYFNGRVRRHVSKHDPLNANLLSLNGDEWKFMRRTLTPTFTSGKMKMMFQTFVACSENIQVFLDNHIKSGEPLEVKDTMARFTTDIIGSCAFGIECNCMKEPDNIFRKYGVKIFNFTFKDSLKEFIINQFPGIAAALKLKHTSSDVENFFFNLVKDTIQHRKENNIIRKDFMDLLIPLKSDKDEIEALKSGKLTTEQIAAQVFAFFGGGFETSSTSMSNVIYELCVHQEIQDKVREEIREVLKNHDDKVTYDAVMEMKYLEQVIDETLRIHPVVPQFGRHCTKDFTFPNGYKIKKGMNLFVPALGLHMDPQYFPDPKVFDPNRFSAEEKANRHPYVYLPFGEGPRSCIGMRFGQLQMRVGLVALLKNYKFTLHPKTIQPPEQDPRSLLLLYKGGIWVETQKVD